MDKRIAGFAGAILAVSLWLGANVASAAAVGPGAVSMGTGIRADGIRSFANDVEVAMTMKATSAGEAFFQRALLIRLIGEANYLAARLRSGMIAK